MASISFYDSSSISVLFSSLNNSSNKTSLLNSGGDLLGINYSDYATIRNGSYFKLMKAYCNTTEGNENIKQAVSSTSTSKDSAKKLSSIESNSDDLKEAADALLAKGSKSVFEKTSSVDENGKWTEKYDTEAIYKAVKKFAASYNDLVDATEDTKTSNIENAAKRMNNLTKANEKLLADVGITVDEDDKLVVDEEKLKKADMTTVKSLFNTTGGYGYQAAAQASMIHYYAESEASKANTYGSNGTYTYNYSTGELYNTSI